MFFLSKDIELTPQLLRKMIERFSLDVEPKLSKYKNYYDGAQEILKKTYADPTKPCNKTVINYCKNITDSYAGYIATPGHISYYSDEDIEDIMNILRYNDYQAEDAAFLTDALIYGTAAELMYVDDFGKTRFQLINPTQCFGIYDDSLSADLNYFVRFYQISDWDDSDTYYVDVYNNFLMTRYRMAGLNGELQFIEEKPHFFGQCPANIFTLPDEKSIFDCVLGLQDSANNLLSSEIDDFSAFCDAYMVITGADMDQETFTQSREGRAFVLPAGATINWLTKNASDTQVENILKRIHDSIYRIAQCPDFSSESFVGGVSSGIAIQYRLTGMENRAGVIEGAMKKALQRRVEIICGIASLALGEEIFRDIQIDFKRNIPADETAKINLINALKGTVSDATLLGQLDFIPDVQAELEALKAQKQENMAMYSFGAPQTLTEEDVEDEV
jgi:SPP1 family phage portal protein